MEEMAKTEKTKAPDDEVGDDREEAPDVQPVAVETSQPVDLLQLTGTIPSSDMLVSAPAPVVCHQRTRLTLFFITFLYTFFKFLLN